MVQKLSIESGTTLFTSSCLFFIFAIYSIPDLKKKIIFIGNEVLRISSAGMIDAYTAKEKKKNGFKS